MIDPLWVGLGEAYSQVRPPTPGRSLASCGTPDPAVVRGFAPPTGGYEASDRKRSANLNL
ncbi:hypothetical protein [uncultured Porphyromonas sp.]|uniref:hypothetical protein n=1 Tax=Porphyromonas sp. TaxID=1924944 RepID=UPI002624B960|nr:hypothetical protein [uncultured Porphyromonas sp.]